MSEFWNGSFAKSSENFASHFDVVGIRENSVVGVVEVTVVFENMPDKEYVFEIDEDDYRPDKQVIAEEILKQLKA